jgi:hypothetical protein
VARRTSTVAETLIAEGERLAKPCLLLQSVGSGPPVGVWRGEGQQPRPKGHEMETKKGVTSTHWITVDCAWLKKHQIVRFDGLLSVYERSFEYGKRRNFRALFQDTTVKLSSIKGELLYGVSGTSFPPFPALCMHGGPAIKKWLKSQGLRRIDYPNVTLNRTPEVLAYNREWLKRTPWFPEGEDGTAAVLGGWHIIWPEDDWYMPPDIQLAIWTLRGSEPWIEVWRGYTNLRVFERIT